MSFMDNAPNIKASTRNPDHPGGKKVHDTHAAPIIENPGPIASDSLAAESTNAHGAFSHNKNAEPLGVTGAHSTFANKNTSGAEKLGPTNHASSRADPTTTADDYTQKSSSRKMNLQPQPAPGYNRQDEQLLRGNAMPAPGYVDPVLEGSEGSRPKGKNLTEVPRGQEFEGGEGQNASFTGEIGTGMDPGRQAEQKMRTKFAQGAEGGAAGRRGEGGGTGNMYDEIGDENA
ncbi:hypothetical protein V493_06539 [Pseudogymnoascus sp. VKM F-4281 (FW-2241)]|nr:hypothetical protein V493_06539 [Pseudogymnoascus sp. VKM F-4281 (FW-2241)]